MQTNMLIQLFKIALIPASLSFFSACDNGLYNGEDSTGVNFQHSGLDGLEVMHLYQNGNRILAATDQGLYSKTDGAEWLATGLSEVEVLDLAIISAEHYLASVRDATDDQALGRLVETIDGGQNWQTVTHNFGGDTAETIHSLDYASSNNAIYATGVAALAASYDGGRSWELLRGMWHGFGQPLHVVKHNPATNEIWFGGQNAVEQMVLGRFSLDTGEEVGFPNLLPAPSSIHDIEFAPNNDYGVYVSGEGGILKTENNGVDWTGLIDNVDHRFYFDLTLDPSDPHTLYTGGWEKNAEMPQPLVLEVSTDGGQSWTEYTPASGGPFGGVRSILATNEADATNVYIGLYEGGVMKASVPPSLTGE